MIGRPERCPKAIGRWLSHRKRVNTYCLLLFTRHLCHEHVTVTVHADHFYIWYLGDPGVNAVFEIRLL
jgi:hypothetical protein